MTDLDLAAPSGDAVETLYSDEDRAVLLRFVRLAPEGEFRMAAVETRSPVNRRALLDWLSRNVPERQFRELSLRTLAGSSVHAELRDALAALAPRPAGLVLVLTDLEEMQGGASEETPRLFAQLNVQRDLLVRDLPVPVLLCSTPDALLRLRTVAPDFCDYFRTLVRVVRRAPTTPMRTNTVWEREGVEMSLAAPGWPPLLRDADQALGLWRLDQALDLIARFRLTDDADTWNNETRLLDAEIVHRREGMAAGRAAYEALHASVGDDVRPTTLAGVLFGLARYAANAGNIEEEERLRTKAVSQLAIAGSTKTEAVAAAVRATAALRRKAADEGRMLVESAVQLATRAGDRRLELSLLLVLADVNFAESNDDAVDNLVRERVLPLAEQLGDVRGRAQALERVARVRVRQGDYDEALRLYREELLPVFRQSGDQHSIATTQGAIAEVLFGRGEYDEALRITADIELPIHEQQRDRYATAITLTRLAGVFYARGEYEEVLRVCRERLIPLFDELHDEQGRAVVIGKIADVLIERGEYDEALRLVVEEELPVDRSPQPVSARADQPRKAALASRQ